MDGSGGGGTLGGWGGGLGGVCSSWLSQLRPTHEPRTSSPHPPPLRPSASASRVRTVRTATTATTASSSRNGLCCYPLQGIWPYIGNGTELICRLPNYPPHTKPIVCVITIAVVIVINISDSPTYYYSTYSASAHHLILRLSPPRPPR